MGRPVWGHCDNCGTFASKLKEEWGVKAPAREMWCPDCLWNKSREESDY